MGRDRWMEDEDKYGSEGLRLKGELARVKDELSKANNNLIVCVVALQEIAKLSQRIAQQAIGELEVSDD